MASILDNQSPATQLSLPECGIAAFGIVQATHAQIAELRAKPHERHSLPVKLLKYADEQTVVAVAAVLHALHDGNLPDTPVTDWGVVAGPRFLGREAVAGTIARFRRRGAPGVSPVLIPYLSLHAVSGMISLALRIHGPNVGVGGGRGSMVDALLTGLGLQQEHRLPGVFVAISAWDTEPVPSDDAAADIGICRAVSLVLRPVAPEWHGLRLRIVPGTPGRSAADAKETEAIPSLADLAHYLSNRADPNQPQAWTCPWCWGGRMEIAHAAGSMAATAEGADLHDVGPARAA